MNDLCVYYQNKHKAINKQLLINQFIITELYKQFQNNVEGDSLVNQTKKLCSICCCNYTQAPDPVTELAKDYFDCTRVGNSDLCFGKNNLASRLIFSRSPK